MMDGTQKNSVASTGIPWKGDSHPPRKKMLARVETKIILAYSAMKNIAKINPEYSTW